MADQSLRDLKARLKLDTSDLTAGQKRASTATKNIGDDFDKTGGKAGRLSGAFGGLTDDLQKFGPVGGAVADQLGSVGLGGEAAAGGIATMTVAAAAGAAVLGFKLAQSASDLNEQLTASRVVFGDNAAAIEKYAKGMAVAGLSEKDAVQATTQIATGLKAVGFQDAALARVSTTLVSLATDLSSFSNIPVPEALEAIQAGLRGEFDPLERFGVHLNADAVAAEAVKEGLVASTSQMTAQAKAAATVNLILQQTTVQQNDVARSGGTLASNTRELTAQMENNKVAIGNNLLPTFVKLTGASAELASGIEKVTGSIHTSSAAVPPWLDAISKVKILISPVDQLGAAIDFLSGRHKEAAKSSTDYASGQVKVGDITKTTTAAIKEQNDTLQKQHDILLGTFNADLQYQQSQLATHDAVVTVDAAQKALNDSVKAYGPNSQQAKDAQEALKKAQLDVLQSSLQEASAAEALHGKWIEEAGGSQTAAQATREQIGELERVRATLAPGSPLIATIDGYINKLRNQIPRNVTTTLTINEVHISNRAGGNLGLASGGPALPGRMYTVGEDGPETLVMGQHGGYVIPHSSRSASEDAGATGPYNITINVNGAQDPALVASMVDQRLTRILSA
jgi:hypothetical protein